MPLIRELTPERIVRDGAAYLDRLEQLGRGPVAITGYCMGGRVGWRIAAAHPERVAALAGFHVGGLVTDAEDSPHRSAESIAAEVYPGAAHGYTMADTPAYDETAAERHYAELFALLDRTMAR